MRRQTVGQRISALEHAYDIEYDGAEMGAFGELRGDPQGAVDRYAGVQERRKLLREKRTSLRVLRLRTGSFSSKPLFFSMPT